MIRQHKPAVWGHTYIHTHTNVMLIIYSSIPCDSQAPKCTTLGHLRNVQVVDSAARLLNCLLLNLCYSIYPCGVPQAHIQSRRRHQVYAACHGWGIRSLANTWNMYDLNVWGAPPDYDDEVIFHGVSHIKKGKPLPLRLWQPHWGVKPPIIYYGDWGRYSPGYNNHHDDSSWCFARPWWPLGSWEAKFTAHISFFTLCLYLVSVLHSVPCNSLEIGLVPCFVTLGSGGLTSNLPDRRQCCIWISCWHHARLAFMTSTSRGAFVSDEYGVRHCVRLLNILGGGACFMKVFGQLNRNII